MSKKDKGLLGRIKERIGLGGKIEDKAAIDYLTYYGFLQAQLEGIPESDDDIIEQSASFARSLIPFMNTRKDRRMLKVLVAYLEIYESYLAFKRSKDGLENGTNVRVSDEEKESRISRLSHAIDQIKDILVTDAKIVQSFIYDKIDHRTVLLNKPYILEQRRTRTIEVGGGSEERGGEE